MFIRRWKWTITFSCLILAVFVADFVIWHYTWQRFLLEQLNTLVVVASAVLAWRLLDKEHRR
jgi:hypothetical protein